MLERPDLKYLMFGEYHGTVEMPGLVADAICAAVATGRPLVVGLELGPRDLAALDAYLDADGGAKARAALLASPAWKEEGGRASAAIFNLVEQARLHGRHHPVSIIAFDVAPEPTGTSAKREAAMADALKAAGGKRADSLVLVLTGAGHADKEGFTSQKPPFLAAAGNLPQEQTLSLSFARPGGAFWGCQDPAGDRSQGCKIYEMPAREPVAPRGIILDPALRGGFDGLYHPGKQYSASHSAAVD